MKNPKIAIILPAYNEALTIAATIADFYPVLPAAEIVVVDNRSSDGTFDVAQAALVKTGARGRILSEPRPGKGNAIRKAFREIEADIYVMPIASPRMKAKTLRKKKKGRGR